MPIVCVCIYIMLYIHVPIVQYVRTVTVLCVNVCSYCPLLIALSLADVMSNQGAQTIISVDVGAEDNNDLTNYGDHLSGWWLLWNSLNPFAKKVRVS